MNPTPAKRSKLEKLISVYERFAQAIASIPDPWAARLAKQSLGVRAAAEQVLKTKPGATKHVIASGFEQGLRDTPDFIAAVGPEWRGQVAKALNNAIQMEYPEFIERDAQRLEKILARGRIRTETEYYLVRHRIDVLEGGDEDLLPRLYGLVDSFDSKG